MSGWRKFFTSNNILAIGIIIFLSAIGTVSLKDIAFVLFTLTYINLLSKYSFPSTSSTPEPPIFGRENRKLALYVSVGATVGLFLPMVYIIAGNYMMKRDEERIQSAATHVFLLASQVFMEGVTFSGGYPIPVRVFVPVFYNSTRIFAILDWMSKEFKEDGFVDEDGIGIGIGIGIGRTGYYFGGKGLAVANLVFWCFNLFGFLLPVYLPRAFKRYYSASNKD